MRVHKRLLTYLIQIMTIRERNQLCAGTAEAAPPSSLTPLAKEPTITDFLKLHPNTFQGEDQGEVEN